MLTKIENLILKECNKITDSDIYLLELYNKLKKPPDKAKYYAAICSLNEKGYFNDYDNGINDTYVTLSTKGYNYKSDTFWGIVLQIVKEFVVPIAVGVISAIITGKLL